MHTRVITLALALGLVAVSAGAVRADETYADLGPYLGAGGVYAIELFDDHVNADNSSGFNLRGGYRLHPNVALEALYEYYAQWDTQPGKLEGWSLSANGKVYPWLGRYQPYAVMGLGYFAIQGDPGNRNDSAFMMRFGGGLDVKITANWEIGPELAYVVPFGNIDEFDFLTISGGVRYNFH